MQYYFLAVQCSNIFLHFQIDKAQKDIKIIDYKLIFLS